jgi:hypothetical protein
MTEMLYLDHSFVWCEKLGQLRKFITNTLKVLKHGAGEGWRISVGPIV